jgi:hypothetical protein
MNPYDSENISVARAASTPASKLPKRYEFLLWMLPVFAPPAITRSFDLYIFSETFLNITLPVMIASAGVFYIAVVLLTGKRQVRRCIAYMIFCGVMLLFHRYVINEVAASV